MFGIVNLVFGCTSMGALYSSPKSAELAALGVAMGALGIASGVMFNPFIDTRWECYIDSAPRAILAMNLANVVLHIITVYFMIPFDEVHVFFSVWLAQSFLNCLMNVKGVTCPKTTPEHHYA